MAKSKAQSTSVDESVVPVLTREEPEPQVYDGLPDDGPLASPIVALSPDGTPWMITVADDGTLAATQADQ